MSDIGYKTILKELTSGETFVDDLEVVEDAPSEETESEEYPVDLASMVTVVDVDAVTAEELELDEEDFEEFKQKVENGEYAIVFDINDKDESLVSIVFEDGFQVFNFPRINLQETELPEE